MDLIFASHLLCAAVYGVLAALLAVHSGYRAPVLLLVIAAGTTGVWALSVAFATGEQVGLGAAVGLLDVLKSVAWVGFLAAAYRAAPSSSASTRGPRLLLVVGVAVALVPLAFALVPSRLVSPGTDRMLFLSTLYARLALTVTGLALIEALLRQAPEAARWRIRYVCLGVGGILAYDLFLFSEALLFGGLDRTLDAARGPVSLICSPLVAAAAARNPDWSTDLKVARRAAVHGATIFAAGLYMLGVAGLAAALGVVGGQWAGLLDATLFFGALLLLAVVWASPSARSVWRQQISRYLFTHRHDYREQWRRFAEALAVYSPSSSLQERALRAVAEVFDSPGGGLWVREAERFARVAGYALPADAHDLPDEGSFAEGLDALGDRVLELSAGGNADAEHAAWIPDWLRRWSAGWLLLPLLHRDDVIGFIVLARPPGRRNLENEDRQLLQIVGRQTASYLAEEQTTRALTEARRFDELSQRMAFIAHDLRKLANELSLMLANSHTHLRNPKFQQDLLQGMEQTVSGMQRLLDRLQDPAEPARDPKPTDLAELLRGSLPGRLSERPAVHLEIEARGPVWVLADVDRLNAISGHLVRNAIEAAGPQGQVVVRLQQQGDQALLEVEDDGTGMTPDFVRERMNHPFGSSKSGGLGLGLYQCREIAEELGGRLAIQSETGRGTVASVLLPLARAEGRG